MAWMLLSVLLMLLVQPPLASFRAAYGGAIDELDDGGGRASATRSSPRAWRASCSKSGGPSPSVSLN